MGSSPVNRSFSDVNTASEQPETSPNVRTALVPLRSSLCGGETLPVSYPSCPRR